MIDSILKRDYSKKPFKLEKITNAILQAMLSENIGGLEDATKISSSVYSVLLYNQKQIYIYHILHKHLVKHLVSNFF